MSDFCDFCRFWPFFGTSRRNDETYRPGIGNFFFGICQGPTELYYSATWPPLDFRFSRKYTFSGQKSTQKSLRPIFDQKGLTNLGHNTRFFALYLGLKNATKNLDRSLTVICERFFVSKSRFCEKDHN